MASIIMSLQPKQQYARRIGQMPFRRSFPRISSMHVPPLNGPMLFHIFYTPLFVPWRGDLEDLTPDSVKYAKLIDYYQNVPRDTLRWQVVANTAVKELPKAVMRERLRRRVREGFREGLKQLGYDSKGRVLQPCQGTEKPSRDVRGTLEIHCRTREGLDCTFSKLVNEAKAVLRAVAQSFNQSSGRPGLVESGPQWWEPEVAKYRAPVQKQQTAGR